MNLGKFLKRTMVREFALILNRNIIGYDLIRQIFHHLFNYCRIPFAINKPLSFEESILISKSSTWAGSREPIDFS